MRGLFLVFFCLIHPIRDDPLFFQGRRRSGRRRVALRSMDRGDADLPRPDKMRETTWTVSALEAAGVIFVPGNGEGPGVRLKKSV